MGLLNGGIAGLFGAAFGGMYLPAILYSGAPTYGPTGEITALAGAEQSCRAQIDELSWRQLQEGADDAEVSIIILVHGVATAPTNDAQIVVQADQYAVPGGWQRWALSDVKMDAAGSHWTCTARRA